MTGNDSIFTTLEDPGDHEHVTYGDNSRGKVLGLGRITISKDLSISNVLFVEALSFNLISIAQLCDLGLMCTFDKNGVVVTFEEDKSLVFTGFRHGNIYLVDFSWFLCMDMSFGYCVCSVLTLSLHVLYFE